MTLPGGDIYDPQYVVRGDRAHLVELANMGAKFLCGVLNDGPPLPRKGQPVCRRCSKVALAVDRGEA